MLQKTTLIFALILINVKIITAQTLSIGPMIGGNVSTINAAPNVKGLVGLSIGGFANYSVNEHFGLGVKLLYSQLGTAFTYTSDITRFHYLQVPVTAIYFFNDAGNRFRPKLFAGLYLGALLGANNEKGDAIVGTDGKQIYNALDVGVLAGIGFNYRLKSRTWLNVDLDLAKSISDITKTADNTYYNKAVGLKVGISFPVSSN